MNVATRLQDSLLNRLGRDEIVLAVALLVVAALILGFGSLAAEVLEGDTSRFDQAVLMALRSDGHPIGPPWLQEMGRDVTALGSFVILGLMTAATVGYLLLVRRRELAALMGVAAIGGATLSTLLKIGFDRPRPEIATVVRVFTASFPSGHATLSTITFLTLGALLTRISADQRIKFYVMAVAVFLTVVVGLSRLYLGVHYPTDVLAGWCVGAAWAIGCWAVARWLQARGRIEREAPAAQSAAPVPQSGPAAGTSIPRR